MIPKISFLIAILWNWLIGGCLGVRMIRLAGDREVAGILALYPDTMNFIYASRQLPVASTAVLGDLSSYENLKPNLFLVDCRESPSSSFCAWDFGDEKSGLLHAFTGSEPMNSHPVAIKRNRSYNRFFALMYEKWLGVLEKSEREVDPSYYDEPIDEDEAIENRLTGYRSNAPVFELPNLNSKSFDEFLARNQHTLVLFTLQVDLVSRYALRAVRSMDFASRPELKGKLAVVHCEHWPELCQMQKIDSWPNLWLFERGRKAKLYRGGYDAKSMIEFYQDSISLLSVRTLQDAAELEDLLKEKHKTVALFIEKSNKASVNEIIRRISSLDSVVITIATMKPTPSLAKTVKNNIGNVGMPDVLLFKFNDAKETYDVSVLKKDIFSFNDVMNLLTLRQEQSLMKLESNCDMKALMRGRDLMVMAILSGGPETKLFYSLEQLSKIERFRPVLFTYINYTTDKPLAEKLADKFLLNIRDQPSAIVFRKNDKIYQFPASVYRRNTIDDLQEFVSGVINDVRELDWYMSTNKKEYRSGVNIVELSLASGSKFLNKRMDEL